MALMALLSLSMGGRAQVSGVNVGYCDGEVNTSGKIASTDKDVWLSGAIYIPAGTMNTYGGNRIEAVKAGLASKLNIDTLTVWLRTSLDGDNIAEGTITGETATKIAKGWNEVALEQPYEIPDAAADGIYIGYSFHQKGAAFGLATLATPTAGGLYVKMPGEQWADRSDEGTLCVEGLVYGDRLPQVNLALTGIEMPGRYAVRKGSLDISGTVKNLATRTITGFDVILTTDASAEPCSAHVDANLAYNESMDFTVTVRPAISDVGDGSAAYTVTIGNIAEGADENPGDNSLSGELALVTHDFTRNILVEEFTTEQCPNCPRVAGYINDALESGDYSGRVFVVCHHSGYNTDWLTAANATSYLWFYNAGGSTYAPAMMIDRCSFGGSTPVVGLSSQLEMENYWGKRLNEPAYVSLDVAAAIDPDDNNKLKVTMSGAKSVDAVCDNPRICVFVVENGIEARNQAGASSFTHNHAVRDYNSTWGDEITWNGNDYEYGCEFVMSGQWVRDNLQVVAFIYNYNEEDATDCTVANAGGISYADFGNATSSAIESVPDADGVEAQYFTLSGVKVARADLSEGIYVCKEGDTVRKVVVK